MNLAIASPAASGQVYNLGSLFLTWQEIGKMIVRLTGSTSGIQLIPSDRWKGPAFLNEIWDLSWDKAERELARLSGFIPLKKILGTGSYVFSRVGVSVEA